MKILQFTKIIRIFKIKKRAIRIIKNSRMRDPCTELFKKLEILSLYSQYIFSISIFVIKSKHLFHTNNQIHSIHNQLTSTHSSSDKIPNGSVLLSNQRF
jgi:hypothetical protein